MRLSGEEEEEEGSREEKSPGFIADRRGSN
jgi:hypothetical protein